MRQGKSVCRFSQTTAEFNELGFLADDLSHIAANEDDYKKVGFTVLGFLNFPGIKQMAQADQASSTNVVEWRDRGR